jgi:hypothetical protein
MISSAIQPQERHFEADFSMYARELVLRRVFQKKNHVPLRQNEGVELEDELPIATKISISD